MLDNGYAHLVHSLLDKMPENLIQQLVLGAGMSKAIAHAVAKSDMETLHFLISKKCDINANAITDDGKSLLEIAIENGDISIVKLLLGKGVDVNKARTLDGATPLYMQQKMAIQK